MNVENRQSLRLETRYRAWIADADGSPVRGCIVRDISAGGAKLGIETDAPRSIPGEFTLLMRDGSTRHRCRVVWRSDENLGVQFLDSSGAALASTR
jgi:hypothetical protein